MKWFFYLLTISGKTAEQVLISTFFSAKKAEQIRTEHVFFLWQAGKNLVPTAGTLAQAVKKNSMRHIDLSSHLLFKCITKAAFDYRKFEITWPILRH